MPRKFSADVVTINFRLPRKLHRSLERLVKRKGTSINAEVVDRLERSLVLDQWPKVEELAMALVMQAAGMPGAEKLAKSVLGDLDRMLGENRPILGVAALINKELTNKGMAPVFKIPSPKG
jgi:hypothetical protein